MDKQTRQTSDSGGRERMKESGSRLTNIQNMTNNVSKSNETDYSTQQPPSISQQQQTTTQTTTSKEQSDKFVTHRAKYVRKSLMGINNLLDSAYARLRPLETIFVVGVVLCCTTLCVYVTHKHLELQNIVKTFESR